LRGNDAGSVDARGESVDRAVRLTRMAVSNEAHVKKSPGP
jgi:hypothetical protein